MLQRSRSTVVGQDQSHMGEFSPPMDSREVRHAGVFIVKKKEFGELYFYGDQPKHGIYFHSKIPVKHLPIKCTDKPMDSRLAACPVQV